MNFYIEQGGKTLFGNDYESRVKVISNRPQSIIIKKGVKIKTDNVEKAREELARDVYVIQGELVENEEGLVVA